MSLKLFVDCIVTAAPDKCSSNIQFLTWVSRALEAHPDWFFYWAVPEWITEEEMLRIYPQSDRVRYLKVKQHKDRSLEYLRLSDGLEALIAFNGEIWDFDILLTVRTGLVPLMRLIANSPRMKGRTWLREFWVIEEMPFMDFKKTVITIDKEVQDRFTIEGYLAADRVWILSYHEKPQICTRAREFFSPTMVRGIEAKIVPTITSQVTEFRLRTEEEQWSKTKDRPLCIAFTGRMGKADNIEEINDIMVGQFVTKGANVELLVCTQSKMIRVFDRTVVNVKQPAREEFWEIARTKMDVMLKMETENGWSLSLFEPLMLGVPVIVIREPWSEPLLGKEYPLFVNNRNEAYAMISVFYEHYADMYQRFASYCEGVLWPLMSKRFATDLLYPQLDAAVEDFDRRVAARFKTEAKTKGDNGLFQDIRKFVSKKPEFVLFEALKEMGDLKLLEVMKDKIKDGDREKRGLTFSTAWNEMRAVFKHLYGYEDASTVVGHLRKVSA